jgi:hypothetical protein
LAREFIGLEFFDVPTANESLISRAEFAHRLEDLANQDLA